MKMRVFMLQAEGSQLVVLKGQLDTIQDKKMLSTGAQNRLESIQISRNWYQTVFETKHIAKSGSLEKNHRV